MLLNKRDYLLHHFLLADTSFIVDVRSIVLVKPDPTKALLVDRDHCLRDVKAPETIVQALKSNNALFQEIQRLA